MVKNVLECQTDVAFFKYLNNANIEVQEEFSIVGGM